MDDKTRAFLDKFHSGVMATTKKNGAPHVAVIGLGLVDGRLWSSGTQTRVRTRHLRADPRATLCVFGESRYQWLGAECRVTILEGDDAAEQNLALYRVLAGEPDDVDQYLQAMQDEQRLIYEFEVVRTYGQY
ncbi:MAG: TIGR03618 family F420-dependent PPOX class oxidoreductase [Actinomycetota bacterium]|nr:TIGR03618 family F420-dependent PPOX class oxidoreductase [Actinomycetota bacterium]